MRTYFATGLIATATTAFDLTSDLREFNLA
jgi:hypothetical protein